MLTLASRRDANALRQDCARCYAACNYIKIMQARYFRCVLSIVNSNWLQHARSVRGVYESYINKLVTFTFPWQKDQNHESLVLSDSPCISEVTNQFSWGFVLKMALKMPLQLCRNINYYMHDFRHCLLMLHSK